MLVYQVAQALCHSTVSQFLRVFNECFIIPAWILQVDTQAIRYMLDATTQLRVVQYVDYSPVNI